MKTPERRQATSGVGEQLNLIEPPAFSPKYPKPSTLAGLLIRDLLDGVTPTHPNFQGSTGSWRLAAYVRTLRKLGWPVVTVEILSPTPDNPSRSIARYVLPDWVSKKMEVSRG